MIDKPARPLRARVLIQHHERPLVAPAGVRQRAVIGVHGAPGDGHAGQRLRRRKARPGGDVSQELIAADSSVRGVSAIAQDVAQVVGGRVETAAGCEVGVEC